MSKVLKVNVYLNDLKDYAAMNEVYPAALAILLQFAQPFHPLAVSPGTR